MKIKFSKKEKSFKKESSGTNPDPYWKFFVSFMFIFIIISFIFGYYLFGHINKEFVLEGDVNTSQFEIIKKERISKVLEDFSLRKEKSNQILNSPAPVIDPSL